MELEEKNTEFIEQPKDYKGLSITGLVLSILCCCTGGGIFSIANLVTSIIALTKSNEVETCLRNGDNLGAQKASGTAKTLNIVTFALLALWGIISIIIWSLYGAMIIATMQSM